MTFHTASRWSQRGLHLAFAGKVFGWRMSSVRVAQLLFVRRISTTMSESRDKMISALKQIVIPTLRDMGFRGSFPHFRREQDGQLDLLMFRFATWGGSFVVDLGYCPPSGYTSRFGKHYPPLKVRVNHLMYWEQLCLGSHPPKTAERRFRYSEDDDMSVYTDIALEVLSLLRSQAEPYWRTHKPSYERPSYERYA